MTTSKHLLLSLVPLAMVATTAACATTSGSSGGSSSAEESTGAAAEYAHEPMWGVCTRSQIWKQEASGGTNLCGFVDDCVLGFYVRSEESDYGDVATACMLPVFDQALKASSGTCDQRFEQVAAAVRKATGRKHVARAMCGRIRTSPRGSWPGERKSPWICKGKRLDTCD